jgi:hypothetical protein
LGAGDLKFEIGNLRGSSDLRNYGDEAKKRENGTDGNNGKDGRGIGKETIRD